MTRITIPGGGGSGSVDPNDPGLKAAMDARVATASGTDVRDDFRTAATGSVPPTVSGHAYTVTSSADGATGANVVDGHLVAKVVAAAQNSVYAQVDLGATVRRIGVAFRQDVASSAGGIGIAIIAKKMSRIQTTDAWLHFEIRQTGWNLAYTSAGNLVTIAQGTYHRPFPLGRLQVPKLDWDPVADVLTIALPAATTVSYAASASDAGTSGNVVRVTDPNISATIGRYVVIEPQSTTTAVSSRIKSWSASAEAPSWPTAQPSLADLAALAAAGRAKATTVAKTFFSLPLTSVGAWVVAPGGIWYGGQSFNGSAAQGDLRVDPIDLSPGTWAMRLLYSKLDVAAIATLDLSFDNGSSWTPVGTVDMYAAAPGGATTADFANITVPTEGRALLRLRALSKNASSGGYVMPVSAVEFTRTA